MSHPFYAICNLFMKFSKTHISFKDTDIARFRHRDYLDITYFTETKNWKHCNKIIFKYVNNTVEPIFN